MEPFEIAADSDRLRDADAVVQFEHRNSTEGIFAKELRRPGVAPESVDLLERHRDTLFS
jgi:hypothetical protein